MAFTGQAAGWPDRPCPTTSPRTAFFWSENTRATKVAERKESREAVSGSICVVPTQRRTSARVNGCALSELSVYSPGRRRKKKAVHIRSAAASEVGSAADWAIQQAWRRTSRGIGWTRSGAGSNFRYARTRRERRGSMVYEPRIRRGSGRPAIVCADATKAMASATVPARTLLWEAESRPSRTR
jgi:hypothetical protein